MANKLGMPPDAEGKAAHGEVGKQSEIPSERRIRKRRSRPNILAKVVEAEQFMLRNKAGQLVGMFASDEKGGLFQLWGTPKGSFRVNIGADGDRGVTFCLHGPGDRIRLQLGAGEDHGPFLGLSDSDGHVRIQLSLFKDGLPVILLNDRDQNCRMGLHILPDGTPEIVLYDQNGRMGFGLAVSPEGRVYIPLEGAGGEYSAPVPTTQVPEPDDVQ